MRVVSGKTPGVQKSLNNLDGPQHFTHECMGPGARLQRCKNHNTAGGYINTVIFKGKVVVVKKKKKKKSLRCNLHSLNEANNNDSEDVILDRLWSAHFTANYLEYVYSHGSEAIHEKITCNTSIKAGVAKGQFSYYAWRSSNHIYL